MAATTRRTTLVCTPRFDADLATAVEATGDDQSEAIRKAVKLYARFLANEVDGGHTAMFDKDGNGGRLIIL